MAEIDISMGEQSTANTPKKSVHSPFVKRIREIQSKIILKDMEKQTATISLTYDKNRADPDRLHDDLEHQMIKLGISAKPKKYRIWRKKEKKIIVKKTKPKKPAKKKVKTKRKR